MTKRILIAFIAFTVIQVTFLYFFTKGSDKKIVYADAIRLFNGYKLKTEMEKLGQGTLDRLKAELDSVSVIYKTNPQDKAGQQLLMEKQQRLSEGYNVINKDINAKVWERLNPVIQKFGKEQGLELMIGANGMGTVLYASDAKDVTEELIRYANDNYEKGN